MTRTQPSILNMLKARLKSSVKQYLAAKEKLDELEDNPMIGDDEYGKARDRERLLRGVVRGCAQMFIAVANPAEASNKTAIADLEIDYGMPGKRSRQRPPVSEAVTKFMQEYYEED
jgi:hypothetical protein